MFSKNLEDTLNGAFLQAANRRHESITLEHLLLALLENEQAAKALIGCGAHLTQLRQLFSTLIDKTHPQVPSHIEHQLHPSLGFQRVLQRAGYDVQCQGLSEVNGIDVLIALFSEANSQAAHFLIQNNIRRLDLVNYSKQHIRRPSKPDQENQINGGALPPVDAPFISESSAVDSLIDPYTEELTSKRYVAKIDSIVGRHHELARTIQILCRRKKNNPLFVGEAGVGKTAIAEGLAQLIVQKRVPEPLLNSKVYALDLGVLLAGTKYRGDFEKRFTSLLKALSQSPGAIIFIDEIHNLIGAGAAAGGTMDASNLLKPLLTRGELRFMGATTYQEFRNFFSKDHALMRRFQKVEVEEPSCAQSVKILEGLRGYYEDYHHVHYTNPALKAAVELASRYLLNRYLPDKAIDVIDEAGACHRLKSDKLKSVIGIKEIKAVVAAIAGIPIHSINHSDKQLLLQLPKRLKANIFGQEYAIEKLCNAIKLSRVGLNDVSKPLGSFLLSGPTGVGKTELAKQLAEGLDIDLIRFDMSEYMERHAVSRLIGSPPGYVGFDQGGLLTEAVRTKPYAVLLLDEIEKAHRDVYNVLLQVMDYGCLTDSSGFQVNFRHVIILMTTNAGVEQLEKQAVGFASQEGRQETMQAIRHYFTPEFRNRLDAVIQFNYLDYPAILQVADKFLDQLRKQLKNKGVRLKVSHLAKQWLTKKGYNKQMGARPMDRLVQEKLKLPLAHRILFDELIEGDEIWVDVKASQLDIVYSTASVKEAL